MSPERLVAHTSETLTVGDSSNCQDINEWIAKNQQKALQDAPLLVQPREARYFSAWLTGPSVNIIAQQFRVKPITVERGIRLTVNRLAQKYDLKSTRETAREQLVNLYKQCQQGELAAGLQLIARYPGTVASYLKDVPAEQKSAVLTKIIDRLMNGSQRLDLHDAKTIKRWFYWIIYTSRVSEHRRTLRENRRKGPKEEKSAFQRSPDLLFQWVDQDPDKARLLIEQLSPLQQFVFICAKSQMSLEQIRKTVAAKWNPSSVKPSLSRARRFIIEQAKISVPDGYLPVGQFMQTGTSRNSVVKAAERGLIPGTIWFSGHVYITRDGFDKYMQKRRVSKIKENA